MSSFHTPQDRAEASLSSRKDSFCASSEFLPNLLTISFTTVIGLSVGFQTTSNHAATMILQGHISKS